MQTYIGTKTVKAEPALNYPHSDKPGYEGYRVVYPDGYESWSPKSVFEASYKMAGTWLDRLRIERDELKARLDKLYNFFESEAFEALEEDSAFLLTEQRNHMAGYLNVLDQRIASADQ